MKRISLLIFSLSIAVLSFSQAKVKKVYDEQINPVQQINEAVDRASAEDKYVVCQVGGNWCKWCLIFAAFIENDEEIKQMVDDNFVYIHVNFNPRSGEASPEIKDMLSRLGNPSRFGYPALVVLDDKGNVVHIQDSSFLESGNGYDRDKVIRFFKNWTPSAVNAVR